MKLTYLGTSAAEAIPAPFCDCDVCEAARCIGGRSVRTRSQALVDGRLLIDYPADTLYHTHRYGLRLHRTHGCLLTHVHHDHFIPEELFARTEVAALMKEEHPFHFYTTDLGLTCLRATPSMGKLEAQGRMLLHRIAPFEPFDAEGFTVTPLEAYHCEEAVIYLIEKEDKALLYANDTGYFPDSTWEYLAKRGLKLDLVSYDCTYGTWDRGRVTHMHLPLCREVRERLASERLLKKDTKHILTHFSHRDGGCGYEKFAPIAEAEGFTVAYDGMEVEF